MTDELGRTKEILGEGILVAGLVVKKNMELCDDNNHTALVSLMYALCMQSVVTLKPEASRAEAKQDMLNLLSITYDSVVKNYEAIR